MVSYKIFQSGGSSMTRKTYSQKACTLSKSILPYRFEMIDIDSNSFGITKMKVPGVIWEFVGNCILTSVDDLDLFQFDDSGKSAFQDNFYSKYDINVSYALEGTNHYVCFEPTNDSIMSFISWITSARYSQPELKKHMSHSQLELYKKHSATVNEKRLRESRARALIASLPFPFFVGAQNGLRMSEAALLKLPIIRDVPDSKTSVVHSNTTVAPPIDRTAIYATVIKKKTPRGYKSL